MSARSPSLTLRLTLLLALASASVLFLLGLFIGQAVERHFVEQDVDLINGKMHLVSHILARSHSDAGPPLSQQLDDALTGHHGLVIAIYGKDGKAIYANEPMDFPASLFANEHTAIQWVDNNGFPWRGMAATLAMPAHPAMLYRIAIATEVIHHDHFMAAFRETLWAFVSLATLVMGFLGWFVVQRGLQPLHAIKHQAAEITANRLHTRLPLESIPRELADLAESLNGMLSRLEDSFQKLSDFSSDLAHELRTPVSNLLTQTQVTLSKARSAEEYREVLASNAEEFERLSRTMSDMLFLAKAENTDAVPHQETIDLAEEIGNLMDYYSVLADEKSVSFSLTGQGEMRGDRLMMRRAVSNLLSNALRHTPEHGSVQVQISDVVEGHRLIAVENTGKDIPDEHLPRLFDRFYRVDSSRQRTTENSGLGLAITKSIVMAHGGEVRVRSGGGKTTFMLQVPSCSSS